LLSVSILSRIPTILLCGYICSKPPGMQRLVDLVFADIARFYQLKDVKKHWSFDLQILEKINYISVFQPGLLGTQRFSSFFTGFRENPQIITFWVSRFRQTFNNVSKVLRPENCWKTLNYMTMRMSQLQIKKWTWNQL